MADKYLAVNATTKIPTGVEATVTSTGVAEAGKIPGLDSSGKLDLSLMPTGLGPDVKSIQASEALQAGDYVNVHNSGGARVRLANASVAAGAQMAHGFVLANVASGANATVYFEGANTGVTGLTIGTMYVLSATTPGKVVALASASTTAGHLIQQVGVATAATEINTEIASNPIIA